MNSEMILQTGFPTSKEPSQVKSKRSPRACAEPGRKSEVGDSSGEDGDIRDGGDAELAPPVPFQEVL